MGAAFDTLREEAPSIARQLIIPRARAAARSVAPIGNQPWLIKRMMTPKLNSVDDRVANMPPEWRGWTKTKRIIVFHDADKAGPHIEMYIEWEGQAYNIGVKRLTAARAAHIRYNNQGDLTQASRTYLMDLIREEFEGTKGSGSFLGQSTDHKPSEARETWKNYDPKHQNGYGAGRARFVLADDDIVVWKTGQTIEGRDHLIDPNRDFYIHRPFQKTMKIGLKHNKPPTLEDRLHLKPYIGEDTWDKFRERVGVKGIMTIKRDGASAYFEVTKHGTRLWSPRVSKRTGKQIEYTHKVKDIRHLKSNERTTGMGELLFKRDGKYLKAHEIGGLLNSNSPIPDDVEPEFLMYRIDKIGRRTIVNEDYVKCQMPIANKLERAALKQGIKGISTPVIVKHDEALSQTKEHEGLVGVSEGEPIINGMKFKPRGDEFDWTLTKVAFEPGDRGGVAGVAWFENEQGDAFKIGASSMGTHENAREMMANPQKYEGRVAKIQGYQGHEGRAARFVDWHEAKGAG